MSQTQKFGCQIKFECESNSQAVELLEKIKETKPNWTSTEIFCRTPNKVIVNFGPVSSGEIFFYKEKATMQTWRRRAISFCKDWKHYKPEFSRYIIMSDGSRGFSKEDSKF